MLPTARQKLTRPPKIIPRAPPGLVGWDCARIWSLIVPRGEDMAKTGLAFASFLALNAHERRTSTSLDTTVFRTLVQVVREGPNS
eukprot:scaffold84771_cov43-Attheya_sp.AAC.1